MRRAEKESLLKSFSVFFVSLGSLSAILLYGEYVKLQHDLKESILTEMRLCSYDLKCAQFQFDFVPLKSQKLLYEPNETPQEFFALFPIPKNNTYALKLSLSQEHYQQRNDHLQERMVIHVLWALVIVFIVSILFSLYALYPLRRALRLTEEFSRDILHDLNTPLSSLRLNVGLLKSSPENEKKIDRINRSIDTIVALGDNLRNYLEEHENLKERVDVSALLYEKKQLYEKLYPHLTYHLGGSSMIVNSYPDGMKRIFDNLLSNASKYNSEKGEVSIRLYPESMRVIIEDTGRGIKHPEKVFDRFYKENERGLGIGLHIVKKLCDQMKIKIWIESSIGTGTKVILDFSKIVIER
ncbi:MAG: sensor histidine kinase [Sulfuricurvum sp.]|uniref:sensor histidine kinase n=1 Tax=Sulfuricurvum sp. TaxID=2025608 RepID=UPI002A0F0750|nr:HAMP domain-containing sensor histidine kinase [Sulfuricurvum sp.]